MKTSAVLSSLLFGSFAVAAPVNKRDMVYKTEVVVETVVIFTTIYEDDVVAQATTTAAGYFYEQPNAPSSVVAVPTSSQAPVYTSAVQEKPSSIYVAPAQSSTPSPSPAPVAPSSVETPQPATSAAYVAPAVSSAAPYVAPVVSSAAPYVAPVVPSAAPVVSSAAPATSTVNKPVSSGTATGQTYSGDITIYDNSGANGACGVPLYDTDMIVALAQPAWGASTYDVMTGASTNPWCGQMIEIQYKGNKIQAKIMDLCPGCVGDDIDLSLAAWKALTGLDEKTRLKATWSKVA